MPEGSTCPLVTPRFTYERSLAWDKHLLRRTEGSTMTTLKVVFIAFVLFLLAGMPVSHDSEYVVAQSADVPTLVRGG